MIRKLQLFFKKESIACCEITEVVLLRFARSLENELNGESAHNYFSKLKQILSFATKEMYFRQNPAIGIRVRQSSYVQKDILSMEELNILCSHPASNNQVKSAFILACYTGLRWVDIKNLTWGSITKDTIRLKQAKTKVVVTIPLHENAKNILGERQKETIFVFKLPSHTSALKCLRAWVKSANIDKHITFHCGRHSYGTSLISNGVDVSIASKLLGHTSLTNTQRYVRISENQKKDAIKKLPTINI